MSDDQLYMDGVFFFGFFLSFADFFCSSLRAVVGIFWRWVGGLLSGYSRAPE